MDINRKFLVNKSNDRINELKIFMKNDENMIIGIKKLGDSEYVKCQVNKYNKKQEERNEEIKELDDKIVRINSGCFDNDILSNINKNISEQKEKNRIRDDKFKQEDKYVKEKSKQSNEFFQVNRKADKENKYEDKDMDRSYNYFVKTCNNIPDYIKNNLKNMPGNKGYFWKNIACYGELPNERGQPITLFDKQRNGLLIIHEWTPKEYNIYHKKDKERRILYSSEERKKVSRTIVC